MIRVHFLRRGGEGCCAALLKLTQLPVHRFGGEGSEVLSVFHDELSVKNVAFCH